MNKDFYQKQLQKAEKELHGKRFRIFGQRLFEPYLWHFNRRNVSKGVSIGLFVGYTPIIGHMLLAAFLAIVFRANLPLSVLFVWISNPFTIPPMFYFAYRLGAYVLHHPVQPFHFEMTWHWFVKQINDIYPPLLLGSILCGLTLSFLGFVVTRLYWRWRIVKHLKKRRRAT